MYPNPNQNIQSAQQQFADSACTKYWRRNGRFMESKWGSDLGKFIENLNNMSGGKRRKKKKKQKSKKNKKKKKRNANKKHKNTKKIRLTRRK